MNSDILIIRIDQFLKLLFFMLSIFFYSCKLDLTGQPALCFSLKDTVPSHYGTPYINTNLIFDGQCSKNTNELYWDFGDGSPGVKGNVVTHIYQNAGNVKITLTGTNSTGSSTQWYYYIIYR